MAKKPVVVHGRRRGLGRLIYLLPAKKITNQATMIGSIGVIMSLVEYHELMSDRRGRRRDHLRPPLGHRQPVAHPHENERKLLQTWWTTSTVSCRAHAGEPRMELPSAQDRRRRIFTGGRRSTRA